MDDLHAIVRSSPGNLLDPAIFVGLLVATVTAMLSRQRWVKGLVAVLLAIVVWQRERTSYAFLREVAARQDMFSDSEGGVMRGVRLMHDFMSATEMYSTGCAILLAALAIVGSRRPRSASHDEHSK